MAHGRRLGRVHVDRRAWHVALATPAGRRHAMQPLSARRHAGRAPLKLDAFEELRKQPGCVAHESYT
jgi:hypothetical protein